MVKHAMSDNQCCNLEFFGGLEMYILNKVGTGTRDMYQDRRTNK